MNSRNSKPSSPGGKRGTRQKNRRSQSGGVADAKAHVRKEIAYKQSPNAVRHAPEVNSAPRFLSDKLLAVSDTQGGERKHLTILVADIPDYSALSNELDPEEAYKIMAHCLAILDQQICHHGGTMTQVTRGVIKGLFGAPISYEDHAKRACEAALSIMRLVTSYREEVRGEHDVDFEMRIGLVSGTILISSLLSGLGLDNRELDELDDLIPQIQAITSPGKVVATKSTYDLTKDFFEFKSIQEAGRRTSAAVSAYELVNSREFASALYAREMMGLSKFVGREEEMSVLMEAAARARNGAGQVVAITGDAGVGKSRLTLEFKRKLPRGQQTFLEGYCRSYDGVPAYHPILDVLKSIFGIQAGEKEGPIKDRIRQRLSCLVNGHEEFTSPLQEIFALQVEDERYAALPFQKKRHRIFQAIGTVLIGASQDNMLVLILEDLHWIDRSSEEVLNYLIGRIGNDKVLLILLYRPEYNGACRPNVAANELHLDRVSDTYVKELVESVLGGPEIDDELLRLICDKTSGNPLFVEEFTRALSDAAAIQRANGKLILAKDASTELLPKTIQDVILARMDRLDKDVKATLQIASVIGSEFPIALLQHITGTGEDLKSHISKLQELEFIYEEPAPSQKRFAFKHALTQEAAYASLLARRKLKIHQKTGEAIEALYSERLEEFYEQLAYHFGKSGDLRSEFKYLKLATIKASRQNSPAEAYQFSREALRCLKKQPATRQNKKEEIEVLTVMNWVLRMLDYAAQDAEQLMKRGEELSLEMGDTKSLALFKAALCLHYLAIGDAMSCRQYSDHLFQDIRTLESACLTKEQLRTMVPMIVDHSFSGLMGDRTSEVLSVNLSVLNSMDKAQAIFEDYDVPFNAYSFLAAVSAFFSSWLGDFDNAMTLCRKALDVALEANDFYSPGFAEFHYGNVLFNRGFGDEAAEHHTRAIKYWEKVKGKKEGAFVNILLDNAMAALGFDKLLTEDFDGARACIEKSIQMHLDSGVLYYSSLYYAYLSMVHLAAGDVTKARSCIDLALDWSQKCKEKHWEGLAKIFLGKILTESEVLQAAKAEASILEGIEIFTKLGMRPYCAQGYLYLGELRVSTGRTQLGAKNLKKAEGMFKEMGMDYWLRKTREVLDRFRASP